MNDGERIKTICQRCGKEVRLYGFCEYCGNQETIDVIDFEPIEEK